jgi:formiminotetrahydrofolate cyclodeaminase
MSDLFQKSLREVLDLAASDAPAPGGGSVSALIACFGLSMTAMVGSLTLGRKSYLEVEPEIIEITQVVKVFLSRLENLVEQDIEDFNRFMTALRLPKNTQEEIAFRSVAMEESLRCATETPLEIARVCREALNLTLRIAEIGNKTAVSDAGVSAVALEAAVCGVLLNAEANTTMLSDQAYVGQVLAESKELAAGAARLRDETLQAVRQRF